MGNSGSSFIRAIFVQGDTVYAGGPDQTVSAVPLKIYTGNPSYVSLGPDIIRASGVSSQLSTNIPFSNYLWSNGATAATITINAPGTYWVSGSTGSCTATDTIEVFLTTSQMSDEADGSRQVFPIPASGYFTIAAEPGTYCELLDMHGRLYRSEYLEHATLAWNLDELVNGLYIVFIEE